MKKILFVSSEAVPYIKTGGLADVVARCRNILTGMNMMCVLCFRSMRAWTRPFCRIFVSSATSM